MAYINHESLNVKGKCILPDVLKTLMWQPCSLTGAFHFSMLTENNTSGIKLDVF